MDKIPNVTPGEILKEEFLEPMGITPYRLAQDTGMPATRKSQILKGNRRITANTALRLSAYFGNAAEFWMGIQDEYDLRDEKERLKEDLKKIPRVLTKANSGWCFGYSARKTVSHNTSLQLSWLLSRISLFAKSADVRQLSSFVLPMT